MHFLGPFLEPFPFWWSQYVFENYEAVVGKELDLILTQLGGSSHVRQHKTMYGFEIGD